MALQISDIGAVLKKIISPTVVDQLNKKSILYNKLKKNAGVQIVNDKIYIATRYGRHNGIYAVVEGTEPRSGKAAYGNPYTSMKYTFGTLELSDQAIAAASGDKKAIENILSSEIRNLTNDIRKDINRQMWGYGDGVLCLTNGTGSTNTSTLTVDGPSTRYLCDGMYITISTATARAISTKDGSTTVSLSTTGVTWANDAKIRKENAISSDGTQAEMMGIQGIVDGGAGGSGVYNITIQNISRSSNTWCQAQYDDTTGTLTEAQMIELWLNCQEYGEPSVVMAGPHGFRYYGSLLTGTRSTHDSTKNSKLWGGFPALGFMGDGAVVLDYDCPERSRADAMLFVLDFDTFSICEMADPFSWLEAEAHGGVLSRSASNRTVWEGTLRYYGNLVCNNISANGRRDKAQT